MHDIPPSVEIGQLCSNWTN